MMFLPVLKPEIIELAFSLQDVIIYSLLKTIKSILSGDKLNLEEDILIYQNKVGRLSKEQ